MRPAVVRAARKASQRRVPYPNKENPANFREDSLAGKLVHFPVARRWLAAKVAGAGQSRIRQGFYCLFAYCNRGRPLRHSPNSSVRRVSAARRDRTLDRAYNVPSGNIGNGNGRAGKR